MCNFIKKREKQAKLMERKVTSKIYEKIKNTDKKDLHLNPYN